MVLDKVRLPPAPTAARPPDQGDAPGPCLPRPGETRPCGVRGGSGARGRNRPGPAQYRGRLNQYPPFLLAQNTMIRMPSTRLTNANMLAPSRLSTLNSVTSEA